MEHPKENEELISEGRNIEINSETEEKTIKITDFRLFGFK